MDVYGTVSFVLTSRTDRNHFYVTDTTDYYSRSDWSRVEGCCCNHRYGNEQPEKALGEPNQIMRRHNTFSRTSFAIRVKTLIAICLITGCASGSDSSVSNYIEVFTDCMVRIEQQYPGSDPAKQTVVCDAEFWQNRPELAKEVCSSNSESSACNWID